MAEPREERCEFCGGREAQVGLIQRHEITSRVGMGTIYGREHTIDVCARHHEILDGRIGVVWTWMRTAPVKSAACPICDSPIYHTDQRHTLVPKTAAKVDDAWSEFSCDRGHIFEWRGTGVDEEVPY
jgi:hypothetical protein